MLLTRDGGEEGEIPPTYPMAMVLKRAINPLIVTVIKSKCGTRKVNFISGDAIDKILPGFVLNLLAIFIFLLADGVFYDHKLLLG